MNKHSAIFVLAACSFAPATAQAPGVDGMLL